MRQLRPYQVDAIEAFFAARDRGRKRLLLVLATGLGKTFVFSKLIERLRAENPSIRVLVVAHRDELLKQAIHSISECVPRHEIGLVKGDVRQSHAPVVVASVASIQSAKQQAKLPQYDLIIIDECHRSLAKSYRNVLNNLLAEGGHVLGVTATPQRGDKGNLSEVFQEIVYQKGIADGIAEGWLCPLIAKRVQLKADFSGLKQRSTPEGKDFVRGEICSALAKTDWKGEITRAWEEHARDRWTIGFLPSVEFAHELAEHMRERGIRAVALDGTSAPHVRAATLAEFGKSVQVLLNCALFTEGLDLPIADCALMARNTASLGMAMQCYGRVTRTLEGKKDALILDCVGVSKRNAIKTAFELEGVSACVECEAGGSSLRAVGHWHGEPAYVCEPCYKRIECVECLVRDVKLKLFADAENDSARTYLCPECTPKREARARAKKEKEQHERELEYANVDLLREAVRVDKRASREARIGVGRWFGGAPWAEEAGVQLQIKGREIYAVATRRDAAGIYYEVLVNGLDLGRYQGRLEAIEAAEWQIAFDHADSNSRDWRVDMATRTATRSTRLCDRELIVSLSRPLADGPYVLSLPAREIEVADKAEAVRLGNATLIHAEWRAQGDRKHRQVRGDGASDKQIDLMRRLRIEFAPDITRKKASALISAKFDEKKLRVEAQLAGGAR